MPLRAAHALSALAAAGILVLAGCATAPPPLSTGEMLSAAGFHMKLADTPKRLALLEQLPAHRFIHKDKAGKTLTVWADPAGCKCLYVGNAAAWEAYQQQAFANHIAYENQQAADEANESAMLNDDAAMARDAGWGWNAWDAEPW